METVYKLIPKGSKIWSINNQMHLILTDDVIVEITNTVHNSDYVYGKPQQLLFNLPGQIPYLINSGTDDWGFLLKIAQDYKVPEPVNVDWSYEIVSEKTPFSDEVIEKLNQHQNNYMLHPYTCDGSNGCKTNEERKLIPTNEGLVCKCGKYIQNWCHKI